MWESGLVAAIVFQDRLLLLNDVESNPAPISTEDLNAVKSAILDELKYFRTSIQTDINSIKAQLTEVINKCDQLETVVKKVLSDVDNVQPQHDFIYSDMDALNTKSKSLNSLKAK